MTVFIDGNSESLCGRYSSMRTGFFFKAEIWGANGNSVSLDDLALAGHESGESSVYERFVENVGNADASSSLVGGTVVMGYEQSERSFQGPLA